MRVSTNWHLQVHFSLGQAQWGREFKTARNNAVVYIGRQHCSLKLPLEVEDSMNTVLEAHMYNQHSRGMETTRHRSLVERGGRKAWLETLHTQKKKIRRRQMLTNLQKRFEHI